MIRTIVIICLTIGAALAADGGILAVPVNELSLRPGPARYAAPARTSASVPSSPDALWHHFDRMTLAEQENAVLSLQPSTEALPGAWDECRAICRLWNSGDYPDAVEKLRGYYRFDDPCRVTVAVSWRKPIATSRQGRDAESRIGNHDSLLDLTMDRSANGDLWTVTPCSESGWTRLYVCQSTNRGSSWSEVNWIGMDAENAYTAWSAACNGTYYSISMAPRGATYTRAWCGRIRMSDGTWVRFAGDSLTVVGFTIAPGDTIRELAECSQEDTLPGYRVYLFGRTDNQLLYMSWSDSSCGGWRPHSTNVTNCDNGLDCTFNQGSLERNLWASWLRYFGGDTARLAFGYFTSADTLFHSFYLVQAYSRHAAFEPTSITAWHDTVQIAFTSSGSRCQLAYTFDAGVYDWRGGWLSPDPLDTSEFPEVSARGGGGFAAAYRSYGAGFDRWLMALHAGSAGGPYCEPDTASGAEHRPGSTSRIRIVPLGSGSYGVGWINWNDAVDRGAWFSVYTPAGIAERPAPAPVTSLSFRSAPMMGGANLSFDNPTAGLVRLRIFDRAGRLAWSERRLLPAGRQSINFPAPASGVYVAVLQAGERTACARFAAVR